MAGKPTVNKEPLVEKVDEEVGEEKVVEVKMVEVKLSKNIRYNNNSYSKGEKIKINENDLEEFKAAKVIEEE